MASIRLGWRFVLPGGWLEWWAQPAGYGQRAVPGERVSDGMHDGILRYGGGGVPDAGDGADGGPGGTPLEAGGEAVGGRGDSLVERGEPILPAGGGLGSGTGADSPGPEDDPHEAPAVGVLDQIKQLFGIAARNKARLDDVEHRLELAEQRLQDALIALKVETELASMGDADNGN